MSRIHDISIDTMLDVLKKAGANGLTVDQLADALKIEGITSGEKISLGIKLKPYIEDGTINKSLSMSEGSHMVTYTYKSNQTPVRVLVPSAAPATNKTRLSAPRSVPEYLLKDKDEDRVRIQFHHPQPRDLVYAIWIVKQDGTPILIPTYDKNIDIYFERGERRDLVGYHFCHQPMGILMLVGGTPDKPNFKEEEVPLHCNVYVLVTDKKA